VYVPSASNIERLEFKLQFAEDFLEYIKNLQKQIPNLVICGDFNICHEEIDIHNPKGLKNTSGFLPVEREWMTKFLKECNLIDSFRYLHPDKQEFSWWSYRQNSRAKNLGWRLDYHFITKNLEQKLNRALILKEAVHSDHCPVYIELKD
jgi:exodeoxyribonuclease-3